MKKKITLMLIVSFSLVVFTGKQSKAQIGSIMDALGEVESLLQDATTAGSTVGNYVTLTKEFKETYAVVEELFCLRQNLKIKLDFAKDHMRTCYFNIRYNNYITTYNSTVRSLKIMVSNIKTMVKIISTSFASDSQESPETTVMQIIDSLNKTQDKVSKLIDTMEDLNTYVDKKVSNRIEAEMLTNYRTNVGQYELILD